VTTTTTVTPPPNINNTERIAAGYAQRAGSALQSGMTGAQLADMARNQAVGQVSNAASAEIKSWLSGAGNVRVKLDADRNFSLKNSQFEILLPWYDAGSSMFFSQHGIHRTDNRNQMNHGIGYRYFGNIWSTGVNTFYDYDLSDNHSRLGVGVEAARDYLRLGANSYLGLSGWRDAPELNRYYNPSNPNSYLYNARPADGWDLRAESWLPAYPQIGGNVRLEQYYGNEVALFNRDNRFTNPMALTMGLNWTPFPLLTFNTERSMSVSSGGSNEARSNFSAGLQLTYRPGLTMRQHLDGNMVGQTRTLLGGRYDFVSRNNNIVLEYQRQV
jgi:adhesin/invasin